MVWNVERSLPRAVIHQGQPPTELLRSLFGRWPIKGHEGCRHPGQALEFGAPPRGRNQSNRNLISAAGDVFFEMMHVHGCWRSVSGLTIGPFKRAQTVARALHRFKRSGNRSCG